MMHIRRENFILVRNSNALTVWAFSSTIPVASQAKGLSGVAWGSSASSPRCRTVKSYKATDVERIRSLGTTVEFYHYISEEKR